ncbi:MAG: uracil-DNA glycosylase [Thermacetogenium sp.]|nr:uracil-DNA glycosylase [Thermacetogenium sp.]
MVFSNCQNCELRLQAKQPVFGEGNPEADLMLVGEAPGADEDRLGRPFVGRAGQLLDKILQAINVARKETYITNVVKCRPPNNRYPVGAEADACFPYLVRQIELIKPKIIVCLGALATNYLYCRGVKINAVHGKLIHKGGIAVVPTFHPAALLRDPSKKKLAWHDFKIVRELYRGKSSKSSVQEAEIQ